MPVGARRRRQDRRTFCDVLTGRDPAGGVIIKLPPHTGDVTLTFDLHNRHTYSEELIKTNRAYRHYTTTIGVLTADNTLLTRAVVQNEFRTPARLDRSRVGRRRSRRRQGGSPDRFGIDQRDDSGRRADSQHPRRKAVDRRARRHGQLQRTGPPDRHHQQRSGAIPARPRPPYAGPTVSGRAELLSIIVPVYNEVATSRAVLDRLLAVDLPLPREIVVVDDGSTDGTAQVLDAAVGERLPLVVFHAERNGGKGTAIRLGLQHARGSIIAIQDADLELDPQQLADLVEPILRGDADVVYGSRFLRGRAGAPLVTFVANRILTGMTNLLFGASLTDMETCYKVMRVDVARSLELSADRFDIEPQITARLLRRGHRIHERPVRFEPRSRAQGKKIGWRDGMHALRVLVAERLR